MRAVVSFGSYWIAVCLPRQHESALCIGVLWALCPYQKPVGSLAHALALFVPGCGAVLVVSSSWGAALCMVVVAVFVSVSPALVCSSCASWCHAVWFPFEACYRLSTAGGSGVIACLFGPFVCGSW